MSIPIRCYIVFLFFPFDISYSTVPSFNDLNWDYQRYIAEGKPNQGMAYVQDLNTRIESSLKEGNLKRAEYLSELLTEVVTTGGPFGISKTKKANRDEKKVYGQSAALIGKTTLTSYEKDKYNHYNIKTEKKEWPAYANSLRYFDPVKEGYSAQQASAFQLLILSSFEARNQKTSITGIKEELEQFLGFFDQTFSRCWQRTKQENREIVYLPANFPNPINYKILKKLLYKGFLDKFLPETKEIDRIYGLAVPPFKKLLYEVRQGGTLKLYDPTLDLEFTLYSVPADHHCVYHSMSLKTDYFFNRGSCLYQELLNLSVEKREEAIRFRADYFFEKMKDKPELIQDENLRKRMLKEIHSAPELKDLGFKATPNGFVKLSRAATSTTRDYSSVIHLIAVEDSTWRALLKDDFEGKAGRQIWDSPASSSYTGYPSLYAYLNNIIVVPYWWSKNGISFSNSPYIPPRPKKIAFAFINRGDTHVSSLRPVSKNLPIWVYESFKGSDLHIPASESYLSTWHKPA